MRVYDQYIHSNQLHLVANVTVFLPMWSGWPCYSHNPILINFIDLRAALGEQFASFILVGDLAGLFGHNEALIVPKIGEGSLHLARR